MPGGLKVSLHEWTRVYIAQPLLTPTHLCALSRVRSHQPFSRFIQIPCQYDRICEAGQDGGGKAADHRVFQKDIRHPDHLLSRLPDLRGIAVYSGGQRVDAAAPLSLCVQYPPADAGPAADAGGRLGELGRGGHVPGTHLPSVMPPGSIPWLLSGKP